MSSTAVNNTPKLELSDIIRNVQELLDGDLVAVDEVIKSLCGSNVELVQEIADRIVNSGGKRLRPVLTLLTSHLCGYNSGDANIKLAAAIELMHTATLLHDDVVDESNLRRGNPTANSIWDNKSSILVGDFLLGQAFCTMVESNSLRVLKILSKASAVIAEGEVKQLVATNDLSITQDIYIDIILSKTATLFSAACEVSPIIAECSEEKIKALSNFGLYLGISFQIIDDVLDYSSEQDLLGKTIGDDFREGKVTLPVIISYAQSNDDEKAFWHKTMVDLNQQEGDLQTALGILNKYDAITKSAAIANDYVQKAEDALSIFPDNEMKALLVEILQFSVSRDF